MALKNSLHRRNHKERAQLVGRKRLGLLEKHKDYSLRARDYHSKQERIRRLRLKAAERNKDEFYFAMTNSKTEKGVHITSRGNASLPTDMVKVLKSQDANYIRASRNAGRKKIAGLREQLMSLANLVPSGNDTSDNVDLALEQDEIETLREAGVHVSDPKKRTTRRKNGSSHLIFVDNEEEASTYQVSSGSPQTIKQPACLDESVDLGWATPASPAKNKGKGREIEIDESPVPGEQSLTRATELVKKHRMGLLKELGARLKRDTSLRHATRELEMQKHLMGKGANKKIRGPEKVRSDKDDDEDDFRNSGRRKGRHTATNEPTVYIPRVYKWKQERKR